MSKPAVSVQGLWKEYRVGGQRAAGETFYDVLSGALRRPFRRGAAGGDGADGPDAAGSPGDGAPDRFWALRDVSFDIAPGDVVGIIGRNGAGKSTLLKILSRITAPTKGRVEVRGRLASLLEVGTGFHPELSGRENIYLNGAILGMTRRDIARKFDEIVAFAEVEKFVDTPVKRYSSGMYVRLAFAVAAHLEPDVLIVDEVLAVGDLAFQRKCLGKMGDVAALGRTVLFVSHNMQAVKLLCTRAFALRNGQLVDQGDTEFVVNRYVAQMLPHAGSEWCGPSIGDDTIQLCALRLKVHQQAIAASTFRSSDGLIVEMEVVVLRPVEHLCIGFDLSDADGVCVFRTYQTDRAETANRIVEAGQYRLRCTIPPGVLNSRVYTLAPRIGIHNKAWIVHTDALVSIECEVTHGETEYWSSLTVGARPGGIAPLLDWQVLSVSDQ